MTTTTAPDSSRDPHLSEAALRQALNELDTKIQTLRNRAHATATGSPNTYQQHADALEAKRTRLAGQLGQVPADDSAPSIWAQIRRGIEALHDDVRAIL